MENDIRIHSDINKTRFNDFIIRNYNVLFLILMAVMAYLCFYKLGTTPIQDWDEARHGVNAYEMLKKNNYYINYYNYAIDYWNLKPPISFLFIMMGYKVFGFNVFGMRVFSALFYFLTVLIISMFLRKKHGEMESLCSIVIFLSCNKLLFCHLGRTGDPDALFIFLFTASMLAMLLIVDNKKWLFVSGFCFSLAFLTKSWHAFLIVAIGGSFLILSGIIKKISIKKWIIFFLSFIIPISIWGITRYMYDGTTFIKKMVSYDLLHRSSNAIEGHAGGILFYFSILKQSPFSFCIVIIGLLALFLLWKKKYSFIISKEILGIGLWIIIPFVAFTVAATKLDWYIYPTCIGIIILGSVCIGQILKQKSKYITIFIALLLCLIIGKGIVSNVIAVYSESPTDKVQNFINSSLNRTKMFSDKKIYIQLDSSNNSWTQSQCLSAELAGDTICLPDGINGFNSEPDSFLIISKKEYSKDKLVTNKIVYENNDYLLISK